MKTQQTNLTPQNVSALLDGELHGADLSATIDALLNDTAAQTQWETWHTCRAALNEGLVRDVPQNFADLVMSQVEREARQSTRPYSPPKTSIWEKLGTWAQGAWKPAGAVAAVLMVSAVGVGVWYSQGNNSSAQTQVLASAPMNLQVAANASRAELQDAQQTEALLEQYWMNHNHVRASRSFGGSTLNYARAASYQLSSGGQAQ